MSIPVSECAISHNHAWNDGYAQQKQGMSDAVVGNGTDSRIAVDNFLLAFGCRVTV